jgi:hypothetical protein
VFVLLFNRMIRVVRMLMLLKLLASRLATFAKALHG